MVWWEVNKFDGALPDEVKEVKIFRVGRVGDVNANRAKTAGRQRPPMFRSRR